MQVRDLIEELKRFDPLDEVMVEIRNCNFSPQDFTGTEFGIIDRVKPDNARRQPVVIVANAQ